MLSISSIVIVLLLLFAIYTIYTKLIVDTFDDNLFSIHLNVLKEYLRTVGDNVVVPSIIGYVTHVHINKYVVTYFNTSTLKIVGAEIHDATREEFIFASQTFSEVNLIENAASVSFVANDNRKFMAHLDDGIQIMSCENDQTFDGNQCAQKPICDRPNVNLPLTGDRLNRILFNSYASQQKPINDDSFSHHPTAYVKCDVNNTPHIEECLNGERFNGTHCVYDPVLQTNGKGVVNYVDFNKITNFACTKTLNLYNKKINTNNESKFKKEKLELNKIKNKLAFIKSGKIFTKNVNINTVNNITHYMVPVNHTQPFDINPCLNHETGHTFASVRVASSQYFECLDNNNLFLHTCQENVVVRNGKYECDKEEDCMRFDDGTGIIINTIHNNNITFDTGKSVCDNYRIKQVVECDTGDFVADKTFSHPLHVTFNVALPSCVFDTETDSCVDYSVEKVHVTNDMFTVNVDTYPNLKHNMIGRVSKIKNIKQFLKSDKISDFVTYSRDVHEIAFDPINFTALDCINVDGYTILFDILDNTRYNVCSDGVFVEEIALKHDEYVDNNNQVQKLDGYKGQCRYDDKIADYFDMYYRNIKNSNNDGVDVECYFTIPKIS
ncbi:vp91 [Psilogramma increta granulovirus]|uniref:Vp91 n=1 Tax=Psilogramma increta granulovirus TaxID=2953508 RepID=A0A977TNX9_9BBAC|nr:vp91 [Psilogramma increta granulovirus]